jgi:hypothetical protein
MQRDFGTHTIEGEMIQGKILVGRNDSGAE